MLSHPAFVLALVGSDTQSEALLAQQNVAAVSGVDGADGVLFRELNNVSLFRIDVSFGMQAADEVVGGFAQVFKSLFAHTGHDVHVQDNIDGVGNLDADFSERRADGAHGVGDDVHGTAFHNAVVHRVQHCVHLIGIHPVVGGSCVLFFLGADESSVLNTSDVVGAGSVIQAAGKFFLVQLDHLAGSDSFISQRIELLLGAVDPKDLVRFAESYHFIYPVEYILVIGKHGLFPFQWNCNENFCLQELNLQIFHIYYYTGSLSKNQYRIC